MLLPAQVARWAQRFGVADAHVRLDHLLSHMIRAVAELDDGDVVFFGGTALCRTYLTEPPWLRLSEDLDLLVVGDARAVTARFEVELPRLLRREFPTRSWTVAPSAARAQSPALLRADAFNVRVQLLPAAAGWAAWRRVPAGAGNDRRQLVQPTRSQGRRHPRRRALPRVRHRRRRRDAAVDD